MDEQSLIQKRNHLELILSAHGDRNIRIHSYFKNEKSNRFMLKNIALNKAQLNAVINLKDFKAMYSHPKIESMTVLEFESSVL